MGQHRETIAALQAQLAAVEAEKAELVKEAQAAASQHAQLKLQSAASIAGHQSQVEVLAKRVAALTKENKEKHALLVSRQSRWTTGPETTPRKPKKASTATGKEDRRSSLHAPTAASAARAAPPTAAASTAARGKQGLTAGSCFR